MLQTLLMLTSIFNSFLALGVQADWNYSTNPGDYDFGWIASGIYSPGSEPYCTYCINGLTYDIHYNPTPADLANGPFWNLTIGTYRCDGVQRNEMWAYHEPTQTIVFGNLIQVLCIDAITWSSLGLLKLRQCNSSAVSQQWIRNGSRVVSALLGPQGEELFMVGDFPDKETNPTSQVYEFDVTLNSSVSSVQVPGYSYSADFTFLSGKNLIDMSTNRFTAEGLLLVANSSFGAIVNGGFERSTIQAGSDITWSDWTQPVPSYFSLCGWVIDFGPIDYVKSGLLQAAEGLYSVHLNTHSDADHCGQVSQTIVTEVGSQYLLSFYFNGFPPQLYIESRPTWHCSPTYEEAQLLVRVTNSTSSAGAPNGGTGVQKFVTMNVSDSNSINFGSLWGRHNVTFWALTNVTTISFTSLNFNNSCGPMVDEVALQVV
ncbi:unnamed protein product [Calypogeia fissa]